MSDVVDQIHRWSFADTNGATASGTWPGSPTSAGPGPLPRDTAARLWT